MRCMAMICVILLYGICLGNAQSVGKGNIAVDLAEYDPGEYEMQITPQKFHSIVLKNSLPGAEYKVNIHLEYKKIKSLSGFGRAASAEETTTCNDLNDAIDTIMRLHLYYENTYIESSLNALKKDLNINLDNALDQNADCDELIGGAEQLLKKLERRSYPFPTQLEVNRSATLRVSIQRNDLRWTFIYSTQPRGEWTTHYGFSFLPNLSKTYHTKQSVNPQGFEIIKDDIDEFTDLQYVPSIFFTWMPYDALQKSWSFGWSAGVGTDLSDVVAFIGFGITYNYNIGIRLGAAFHQVDVLKSKYSEGEVLSENLEFDDLHRKAFRPNGFFSIVFRLGSNPFSNPGEQKKGTNAEEVERLMKNNQ